MWLGAGILLLGASDAVLGLESRTWVAEVSHALRLLGYLAVARIVIASARHSIRFRFILGFSALLVAVVLFVSGAIGTVIDRNLREGAIERVLGQAEPDHPCGFEGPPPRGSRSHPRPGPRHRERADDP
jgi:hypothetical protein